MSVLKSKRKESQFEVFHHLYQTRRKITALLLRDFGYKPAPAAPPEGLSPKALERYNARREQARAFETWFILDQRACVMDCLREITKEVFMANSIYPAQPEELTQRRLCQDRAIGQLNRLLQELQYAMETLPVDVDKLLPTAEMIEQEIKLIKAWRKSDNKFKANFE